MHGSVKEKSEFLGRAYPAEQKRKHTETKQTWGKNAFGQRFCDVGFERLRLIRRFLQKDEAVAH